jgi:hypothetical protein
MKQGRAGRQSQRLCRTATKKVTTKQGLHKHLQLML